MHLHKSTRVMPAQIYKSYACTNLQELCLHKSTILTFICFITYTHVSDVRGRYVNVLVGKYDAIVSTITAIIAAIIFVSKLIHTTIIRNQQQVNQFIHGVVYGASHSVAIE